MKARLDVVLVERGLVRSRSHAQQLIVGQKVLVNGLLELKPSREVDGRARLNVEQDRWVSRASHKLIGALDATGIDVPERVLDAGASTGGFTQVLLSRGAKQVYAVDVGHGQLASELRDDPRVRNSEGLNLRDLTLADVDGEPVGLAVADVSFISLKLVVAPVLACVSPAGAALLMVKPQFEVGRDNLDGRGVVRDVNLRVAAVDGVAAACAALGWRESWRGESQLPGQDGNVEYFLGLRHGSA
jgi:23S rRNA (cytidine1920-2'-O)/16S rRNA (cytidine1409-2'-O)-methyltransferase